jgi:hypothetical protein
MNAKKHMVYQVAMLTGVKGALLKNASILALSVVALNLE